MCSGAVHHLWRSQVGVQPVHPAPGAASGASHHQLIGTNHQSLLLLTDVWTHFLSVTPDYCWLHTTPADAFFLLLLEFSRHLGIPAGSFSNILLCVYFMRKPSCYTYMAIYPCSHVFRSVLSLFPTSCSLDFIFCHCGRLISPSGMRVKGQNVILSSAATLGQLEQCMLLGGSVKLVCMSECPL